MRAAAAEGFHPQCLPPSWQRCCRSLHSPNECLGTWPSFMKLLCSKQYSQGLPVNGLRFVCFVASCLAVVMAVFLEGMATALAPVRC